MRYGSKSYKKLLAHFGIRFHAAFPFMIFYLHCSPPYQLVMLPRCCEGASACVVKRQWGSGVFELVDPCPLVIRSFGGAGAVAERCAFIF